MKEITINFLGDSITEGTGAPSHEYSYSALLAKMCKAKEGNYGLGGSRIAKQKSNYYPWDVGTSFEERARLMSPADFLFIFGGTNDFGHGDAPLGEMGDTTADTFYGALHSLFRYLLEEKKWTKERMCFILPLPRCDQYSHHGDGSKVEESEPLSAYIKAIKEVAALFGIETLSLSLPEPPLGVVGPSEYYIDGLHPNAKGHEYIAEELFAYLKEKNILSR